MAIKLRATTPSFTSKGYLALLPTRFARAEAHSGVRMYFIAFCRLRCFSSAAPVVVPLTLGVIGEEGTISPDQSDLTALTSTRVPSLFTGIESDRRTSASITERPVGGRGVSVEEGRTRAKVHSTKRSE